ncbi:hypothetical protein AP75_00610 [Kaistella haifensis DSM 19056]|uniref:Uncharacterized protein n=1 Tax=Kaistella haifensis DSM 19056 TaxID=1450526 RepID=A0A246BCW2_9FLAO|nr:hypothetical protein [Kaistella haifensis]OWK99481.1 hypothetical protein AP75_00610 [Kaistella haifensis DSM 19056]
MKTDKSQDKYNEIFQELREEKMNWDFKDFLAEAEKEKNPTIEVSEKKSASFPKFYWMVASVVLLVSMGVFYNVSNQNKMDEQDQLVKNEILKQKDDFGNNNEIVAVHSNDSLKTASDSLVTDSVSISNGEDVIEKILPKRGRIKRQARPQFVDNSTPEKSATGTTAQNPEYESNYVIINGQKIENEQEAIDLTKYSFRILSENVSKTVASTEAVNSFIND